ncbi:MAG: DUF4836 family protein [Prevotellaceae bacterium]|jgi:hypothetical protein|nr:DUF4836 family protein [Prevotellaceae bacterium]
MKTIKFTIIIALCSVIICGCSKKSATPPHLLAVPQDAAIVLAFNAKQITEKSGLNNIKQYKFYQLIEKELNQDSEETKFINDFLKNTRTSGLNLDNVFVYVVPGNNVYEYSTGITFLIDDLKTFEGFIEKLRLGDLSRSPQSIMEDRKIAMDEGYLQWNDEIAVILVGKDNNFDLLNKDEAKSILANELFKSEYSDKNDAYFFAEYNSIIKLVDDFSSLYLGQSANVNFDTYKDISLSVSVNSEKGEFVATAKMLPAEKAKKLFDKFYKTDFNADLYKYFPDKSMLAVKVAIKPLDVYNEYKKSVGLGVTEEPTGTTNEEVEILDEDGNVTDVESIVIDEYSAYSRNYNYGTKMLIEQYDAKITSVLENFTGDFLGSLFGITNGMPDFALAAGITEGKENDVIALIEEAGFAKNPDDYYSLSIQNFNFYFAVNNNIAYLTGNTESMAKFFDNGYSSNITSAKDLGKELKSAVNYGYLDININNYPAIFKFIISTSPEGKLTMPLLEKLKSITAKTDANSNEFKIKFNDSDSALKIILKGIDDLIVEHLGLAH